MTKEPTISVRQAAQRLKVAPKWVRGHIASGLIAPKRTGNKKNGRFELTDADIETLRGLEGSPSKDTADPSPLARLGQLEADRTNLLAQVAWSRAIAKEQGKALEVERERAARLAEEVEHQRKRVEQLKALSAFDRVMGRHKAI